jgi:YaiO family outer membrane protein
VALGYLADAFPGADAPSTWHELVARVGRTTPLGPLLARVYGGRRFDRDDAQAELELFPVLRKGTYLDLALAASPWRRFYPSYRAALDGYQALGAGFELTLGYRRLGFASPADLGTAGLAYYTGAWLLSARALVAAGGALSGQVAVRRTFGADLGAFRRGWLGLRYAYGRGAARLEARAEGDRSGRDGHAGGLELVLPSEGLELTLRAGYAAEPLPAGSLRHQVSVAPEVLWRF